MRKNRFLFLFITTLLLCPLSVQAKGFSSIYVLGDSLSDQGNLFQATSKLMVDLWGYPPDMGFPAADHYYQGRFANGENYVDGLADKLDLLVEPSILGGSNFAYGGARIYTNTVESVFPSEAYPWSLSSESEDPEIEKSEIKDFINRGINDPEALYVLWAGANDVADIVNAVLTTQDPAIAGPLLSQVVEGLRQSVEAFIAAGARDIFVPLIPDLGLVPLISEKDPLPGQPENSKLVAQTATELTVQLNLAILAMLENYSDVNIMVFDTFSVFRQFIATPRAYGFKNVSEACYTGFVEPAGPDDTVCDNPEDYLFWDAEHPTTAAHQVLADLMLRTIIDKMLSDFIDDLKQLKKLPGKAILIKDINVVQHLLTDNKQKNDFIAIINLKMLVKILERLGSSPFVGIDTGALSARAQQIVELAEANLP